MTAASRFPSIPAPPRWAERFHSDDLDEVREFVGRTDGEHSRVAHRAGALDYELCRLRGTTAAVAWGRVALLKTIRGALQEPALHVEIPAGSSYRVGRREHSVGRSTAMFLAPGWEFTRTSPGGSLFAVSVGGRRLAEEVEARDPGGRGVLAFRSRAFELDEIERAGLFSAVQLFARALGSALDGIHGAHGEALLIAAVADLLLKERVAARVQGISASRIANLEAWIENHLEEPLTIGRLCEVAGVGERSLQKAFESHRGVSPMRFVSERRLAEARRRLANGSPRDSVTRVALGVGFHHMGRFAKLYRETFGEGPSQSLGRAARLGALRR